MLVGIQNIQKEQGAAHQARPLEPVFYRLGGSDVGGIPTKSNERDAIW